MKEKQKQDGACAVLFHAIKDSLSEKRKHTFHWDRVEVRRIMEDREKKTSIRENDISKKVPLGAKRRSSIHLSIYAMFLAISMILGYVEAQLPTPIPIPGVKLGLANLVNILMLFSVGPFPTAVIGFLRIILLSLLFGNALTLSYSLSGFLCSFLMMLLFKNLVHFSTVSVSLIGGIFHNIGQVFMAAFLLRNTALWYYLPYLLIAGSVAGVLIGILGGILMKRLKPFFRQYF